MKKIRILNIFLGVLWEWVIIPILFYVVFPKGEKFQFLFPQNIIIKLLVSLIYLFFGLYFTISSIYCLHVFGKGTMMPNDPPQMLVKEGVYSFCRNPMYLGYSFLFFAFSFLFENISFLFLSFGVIIFIFLYSKMIEEKILLRRFGNEYWLYKKETPFIVSFKKQKNPFYIFSTFLFLYILFSFIKAIFLIAIKQ
ncbi:MAG: hypothetical protein NC926_04670 [Candidatus Omnitrophica bacterium]|nr:hypothetical protein [Candidatus Omnitrophota bacterium]